MTDRPAQFAAVYAILRTAADTADHWVQSDFCAQVKGATDTAPVTFTNKRNQVTTTHGTADGRRACAWHVLTYTATQALALAAGSKVLGLRLRPGAAAAALAVSAVSHYAADRRVPGGLLHRLANATGKGQFLALADHGINGAYALDQAWHHSWEAAAAAIAVTWPPTRRGSRLTS